ncbi:MAG: hypothetical protein L6408_02465, partial [Nanoarchaeota archaeon]|nr:hypothetical protein [Nanoarchaeota archaeon]
MKAKYKVNKKAQISPVFKYIFMLVVGTIILIFFIRFAMKTEETGTEVIKAEVLHALDAAMQAFSVSEYSSGVIP